MNLTNAILILLTIGVFALLWVTMKTKKIGVYPATSSDWFVEVKSNAEAKKVTIHFYPILAFKIGHRLCLPVTACPYVTDVLMMGSYASDMDLKLKESENYGRWFRHSVGYSPWGTPCWTNLNLESLVNGYLYAGFLLIDFDTPPEYRALIASARKRNSVVSN